MASGSTLTQDVYRRLRADLLSCRLAPGEKLRIEELCRRLCAGSSAVRETLSRLASEGFVVAEPQRGFRVAPVLAGELRSLTDARCQIEGLCIRSAVQHGDVEWEAGIITALHRLSKLPVRAEGDPKRYDDAFALAHTAFHEAIAAACDNSWLLRTREFLAAQHERYRWLSLPLATTDRDLHGEHAAIADAALSRDADRTVQRTTEHLDLTMRIILSAQGVLRAGGEPARKARPVAQRRTASAGE